MRKKPYSGPSSWTWFIHSLGSCMIYLRHRGQHMMQRNLSLDPMSMVWLGPLILPLSNIWPNSSINYLSNILWRMQQKLPPHPKMQMFLHRTLRRGISSPVGRRREERKGREIKTSRNPQIVLMGVGKKSKRWNSYVSCAMTITSPIFVPLWNKPKSC